MAKSIIDYILEEDQARYKEIIENAAERKMNAPREKKERKPMSVEAQIKAGETRLAKLQAKLAALRAGAGTGDAEE